jgi:hypothetical protein
MSLRRSKFVADVGEEGRQPREVQRACQVEARCACCVATEVSVALLAIAAVPLVTLMHVSILAAMVNLVFPRGGTVFFEK